jgi:hypothetical protein
MGGGYRNQPDKELTIFEGSQGCMINAKKAFHLTFEGQAKDIRIWFRD